MECSNVQVRTHTDLEVVNKVGSCSSQWMHANLPVSVIHESQHIPCIIISLINDDWYLSHIYTQCMKFWSVTHWLADEKKCNQV